MVTSGHTNHFDFVIISESVVASVVSSRLFPATFAGAKLDEVISTIFHLVFRSSIIVVLMLQNVLLRNIEYSSSVLGSARKSCLSQVSLNGMTVLPNSTQYPGSVASVLILPMTYFALAVVSPLLLMIQEERLIFPAPYVTSKFFPF